MAYYPIKPHSNIFIVKSSKTLNLNELYKAEQFVKNNAVTQPFIKSISDSKNIEIKGQSHWKNWLLFLSFDAGNTV